MSSKKYDERTNLRIDPMAETPPPTVYVSTSDMTHLHTVIGLMAQNCSSCTEQLLDSHYCLHSLYKCNDNYEQ